MKRSDVLHIVLWAAGALFLVVQFGLVSIPICADRPHVCSDGTIVRQMGM